MDRKKLTGRWVHAHEEDTGDEAVYRPADHELPPARGREALELREDGGLVTSMPGPVDRPEEASGSWELDDDLLVLRDPQGSRACRVVAAEPDRLVLAKATQAADPEP